MALSCKVGTITEKATTGSQAYTGVGFQPKALITWGDGKRTTSGADATAKLYMGLGTASTARVVATVESRDAQATSDSNRYLDTVNIIRVLSEGVAADTATADLTSLDADGFTLNWGNVHDSGNARLHNYMALGGDDLTNAKAGTFTSQASGGNQAVTGVGFQPDCVILLGGYYASVGATNQLLFSLGVFDAAGNQWCVSCDDVDSAATINSERTQRTDVCHIQRFNGSTLHLASFVSMDSDGFTINWTNANSRVVAYLALKGGQFKLGSVNQKTSTGTQGYTGVGFQPVGLLLASFCNTTTAVAQASARIAIGAASGSTDRAASWIGSTDNVADSVTDSALSTSVAITMQTEGTPTEDARADLDSFDSDGFTLDWEVADATAREILYLAFGSTEAAAPTGQGDSYFILTS